MCEWKVLAPLPHEMKESILRCGILGIFSICAVDSAAAILAIACTGTIDWTTLDNQGWFFDDFTDASFFSVPEWQTNTSKRSRCGGALSSVVQAKATSRYVDKFRNVAMRREYDEAV